MIQQKNLFHATKDSLFGFGWIKKIFQSIQQNVGSFNQIFFLNQLNLFSERLYNISSYK